MSGLPELVDAWRMVATRRRFQGKLPLREMARLRESLAQDEGMVAFELEFGRDEFESAFLALTLETTLVLICQRTLEPFELPVKLEERLGLIRTEAEEAGLPPGYEALLTDGELNLADVIEDELILAVPLIPMRPGADSGPEVVWSSAPEEPAGPFAALARLKKDT